MTKSWEHAKNILIIRADNMGDLIMSGPAIRALKQTFSSKITLLTSSMAAGIATYLNEIDDVIVFDLPWIKTGEAIAGDEIFTLVQQLKERRFDGAVIFTVFSQNAMPAAMIAYMAGIPLRLAYSRENPYKLLTNWVPDKEPYTFVQHQVLRDIALVNTINATAADICLHLDVPSGLWKNAENKLLNAGVDTRKPWLIFHTGVSEKKREYPEELWARAAKKLIKEEDFQILFTGSASEQILCEQLQGKAGENTFSVAGLFSLGEFITLIEKAPVVVSVNTGTIHICAAVKTPVVVLYAQTNPQHTPWMVPSEVLEFEVEETYRSKNEVIRFLYKEVYNKQTPRPDENDIFLAVNTLLGKNVSGEQECADCN
jgi:lipopolysaccharide heptosyltransferase II